MHLDPAHIPRQTVRARVAPARRPRRYRIPRTFFLLVLMWALPVLAAGGTPPVLESDTAEATAGYFRLNWHGPADASEFELQEANTSDFAVPRIRYRGPDEASVISGRRNGTYYYRVRAIPKQGTPGPWSDAVAVEVNHHPLARAFGFFTAGSIVFVATLALIVGASVRSRRGRG
jgi:hypothetical protein